jgi:hypothetical protein
MLNQRMLNDSHLPLHFPAAVFFLQRRNFIDSVKGRPALEIMVSQASHNLKRHPAPTNAAARPIRWNDVIAIISRDVHIAAKRAADARTLLAEMEIPMPVRKSIRDPPHRSPPPKQPPRQIR